MTVGGLKQYIAENNVPDTATIFVWAEYGADGEQAYSCDVSTK